MINWLIFLITMLLDLSCSLNQEKNQSIDLDLLKSDWLNAKYGYILFFNDSTVLTPPNEHNNFLFEYHVNFDTLFIENIDYQNIRSWEKYQVLTLNSDLLIMKNISKTNFRLPQDTISLINTKTINYNNLTYQKIYFSFNSGARKIELKIEGDSLTFIEYDSMENYKIYHSILSTSTINQINRKLELLDPETNIISVAYPGVPSVSLKLEFNGSLTPFEFKNVDPMTSLRLAGLITYLNNLDQILRITKE